jgi:hypothetical protein
MDLKGFGSGIREYSSGCISSNRSYTFGTVLGILIFPAITKKNVKSFFKETGH